VRGNRNVAAGLLCLGVVLALLLPVSGIAGFVVRQSVEAIRAITETVQSEGITGLIEHLPRGLRNMAKQLLDRFPLEEVELNAAIQEQASMQTGKAARAFTGALAATGSILVQTIMMLIALFFLLVDGARLVNWVEDVSPLEKGQAAELMREFRKVSVSVLASSLATAGVQAVVALVGFLITPLPHPLFFATVTFFVAFIPAVGAGGMCLMASLVLLARGELGFAIFLAVWGLVAVGLVDNVIKPLLVRRGLSLHGALVFFALLGGLAAFGAVGLLLGPLIVSFFLALLRIYQRDYGRRSSEISVPPEAMF
jgi:predicted PurR-regulated permease PerM